MTYIAGIVENIGALLLIYVVSGVALAMGIFYCARTLCGKE